MSKSPIDYSQKSLPVAIPKKRIEESKSPSSKSSPERHDDFFIGSPRSGASQERYKISNIFLTSLLKSGKENLAEGAIERWSLVGEESEEG